MLPGATLHLSVTIPSSGLQYPISTQFALTPHWGRKGFAMRQSQIYDPALAPEGRRKIEWVRRNMPILNRLEEEFRREQTFAGLRVAVSVHFEAKTAYLAEIFAAGGADVSVTGSNSLSTKDDVAAAVAERGLHVYATHGASPSEFQEQHLLAIDIEPNIVIDDGGDLVHDLHVHRPELIEQVYGACEETTSGVIRDSALAREGRLRFPVLLVNNAQCKFLFDNRYGTGQSTWEAIMRTTNLNIAGSRAVIVGYGWCGKGCAMRAKGLGAEVIVCEVDPIKAVEAVMDGFRVMPMQEAAAIGDFFLTVSGGTKALSRDHFALMHDGAILANAGHFNAEIDLVALRSLSAAEEEVRENITAYRMAGGRTVYLLGGGGLVNITCGDGHPAEIMDTSFALQALSARYVAEHRGELNADVYPVPEEIDNAVARLKLETLGIRIDELTGEQEAYLRSAQ